MPTKGSKISPEISSRFKQVREFLGLTQVQIAEICECSLSTIAMIETGKRDLTTFILVNLYLKKNISSNFVLHDIKPIQLKSAIK